MEKYITKDGQMFLDSLFESYIKSDGKSKTGSIKFVGENLNGKAGYAYDYRVFIYTYMLSMRKKYGFKLGYSDEFNAEYAVAISIAVSELADRFPEFDAFKNDKKVQLETMKYMKQSIKKALYMSANPDVLQTRNGKNNVFIHSDVASLDELKERSLANDSYFELDETNRIHKIDEDEYYQFNSLVQHFLENRTRILTNKQNQFYEAMCEAYVPANHVVSKKVAFEEADYTINQFNRFKNEIYKRTLADFEQFGKRESLSNDSRVRLHKVFKQYLAVIDTKLNTNLTPLNLSMILRENYENEQFEVVILKGLTTEDKQHVVRVVKGKFFVNAQVAHKIALNIEEYLENNQVQKVEPSDVKSTYTEHIFRDSQRDSKHKHFKIDANGVSIPADFDKKEEVYA